MKRLIEIKTIDNFQQKLQILEYTLRQSRFSKTLRITIYPDNRVAISAPKRASISQIERFILSKQNWIILKLKENEYNTKKNPQIKHTAKEIAAYKKQALIFVKQRTAELNKAYGFSYGKISVRNQKSRWGSCSKKGNLNFNYKIILLPPEHADYIIIHELCHLKEFNHSAAFWNLVAQTAPNYKKLRTELRNGKALGNLL
jgi:predicted metal-dependent hydrolase